MKVKTSELSGAALDYAVSITEGFKATLVRGAVILDGEYTEELAHIPLPNYGKRYSPVYRPSTDWSQGGPIVDELLLSGQWQAWQILEGVTFMNHTDEGLPLKGVGWGNEKEFTAETTLIAACRVKVFTKLGDTVDIPEELL